MMQLRILPVLAALCVASPAASQSLDRAFWLQAAAYRPSVDTMIRVDATASNLPGSTIDFERDLKFSAQDTLPSISAGARIGRRWRVVADVYRLSRKRTATLDQDIEFDGVLYPVNAEVSARFSSEVYKLAAGYSIVARPNLEIGGTLGAHVTSFNVSLAGQGSVNGGSLDLESRRRRVLAPLPTLGVYADWSPAPRLMLGARADALSLKIGDYRGRLLAAQISASYEIANGLAVGAMWRHVNYRLNVDKPDWNGRLSYRFSGPAAYLEYRFGAR